MALAKQSVPINFSGGLDTKSDDKQVPLGKFLSLKNSVFTRAGLLQKRNGYGMLPSLPDSSSIFTTTFNGNLTAIGSSLLAYSEGSQSWGNKGNIQPLSLSVLPLIRSNTFQSQMDSAIAPNGLICTVYTDNVPSGGSTVAAYKYVIADSVTGQNVVAPTTISVSSGAIVGSPRVFLLGSRFIIVFTNLITATNHLQYVAINTANPTTVTANTDLSSSYTPATTVAFDGVVANNSLYLAWNGADMGGAVRMTYLDSTLVQHSTKVFAGSVATMMSVTADLSGSTPIIYASFYDSVSQDAYSLAVNQQLDTVRSPIQTINNLDVANITSVAINGVVTVYYELNNEYSYDTIASNYIRYRTMTVSGTLGTATTLARSVGLASKAFLIDDAPYVLSIYSSTYQPTYFLLNGSGQVISKLAYENAGGYYTKGLPSCSIDGSTVSIPYLFKDLLQAANKSQTATSSSPVYTQTGINLVNFTIGTSNIVTAEIGQDLHLSGGFLWMYDGYMPVEHGFHLYPDDVEVDTSTSGGFLTAQQYFYQVTYEWTDNQGNLFRSAPSLPVTITTTGSTSSNTLDIPTLRLTYKTANPVKIVIYRWSVAQQTYYQVTSITIPLLNNTAADSVQFVDTLADSSILGNNIIYTTGGVAENIAAPACSILFLFNNRLCLVPSEDPNLLWFSKQVIEATPVETSDLLTLFVAPTTSAQGSTGPTTAGAPMDDKAILFKANAIYYFNGEGPDNTGANSSYSQPIFITSTVGCANQQSIVFTPNGLMFQSDKGIWLLGRDLSTSYIGAPVEEFTDGAMVESAVNVPGTNQVRFTMDTGITLMYDYYYGQWGSFANVPAISSTLYQNLHTYINSRGQVFQETPGLYLDGSSPVLMSFTTSWFNLAGLQGFERFYELLMIGKYLTPFKLNVQIAYDYNPSPQQSVMVLPDNFSGNWGSEQLWGSGAAWGGSASGDLFEARVFPDRQKVESFQITVNELYDPTYGVAAGAGLTLSGLNLVVGLKKAWRTSPASKSFG